MHNVTYGFDSHVEHTVFYGKDKQKIERKDIKSCLGGVAKNHLKKCFKLKLEMWKINFNTYNKACCAFLAKNKVMSCAGYV